MRSIVILACLVGVFALAPGKLWASGGQVIVRVVDHDTQEPIACRAHLENGAQKAQHPPGAPFWDDHFVFPGEIKLKLAKGKFPFDLERGPEYLNRFGHVEIDNFADDQKTVDLQRFVDMAKEGWWSGDLNVERPPHDIELLMEADDLRLAPLVTVRNQKSQWTEKNPLPEHLLVETDARRFHYLLGQSVLGAGGSVLLLNLREAVDAPKTGEESPSLASVIAKAREQSGAWIDVEQAASWDLPVWVAEGLVDSIELANSHFGRAAMNADEAGCRPRDLKLYPGSMGIGRWNEAIYYHLLNCGLRIPPSAGSGSGLAPNPVGYNRVYVHLEEGFGPPKHERPAKRVAKDAKEKDKAPAKSVAVAKPMILPADDGEPDVESYRRWWDGLRAGHATVTNGPLIRPSVEGQPPGYIFSASQGDSVELEIALTLQSRDKVSYLEVVRDGRVVHTARLDEWAKAGGKIPPLKFDKSGWVLVRVVTDNSKTYRFAMSAPYYVEIGGQRRVSKASAEFFVNWIHDRKAKLKAPSELLDQQDKAEHFWQALADKATDQ